MELNLESLRQKCDFTAAFEDGGEVTLDWRELVDLLSAVEELQAENAELEEANRELHDAVGKTEDLPDEVDSLKAEVSDLRVLLDGAIHCSECNTGLRETMCTDCYNTGGR